jgi:hypothetical protein
MSHVRGQAVPVLVDQPLAESSDNTRAHKLTIERCQRGLCPRTSSGDAPAAR